MTEIEQREALAQAGFRDVGSELRIDSLALYSEILSAEQPATRAKMTPWTPRALFALNISITAGGLLREQTLFPPS